MSISDLIAVMRDGKVVQYGPPREIYTRPRNLYVAAFVGKPGMSLMEGRLEDDGSELRFVGAGIELQLGAPREVLAPDAAGDEVTAGVRAEDVRLVLDDDPVAALQGVVQLVEPVGSDTFVEVEVAGNVIVVRVSPELDLEIGQTVRFHVEARQVHLFERPGGERINRRDP